MANRQLLGPHVRPIGNPLVAGSSPARPTSHWASDWFGHPVNLACRVIAAGRRGQVPEVASRQVL